MTPLAKVAEISAASPESLEAAIRDGLARAAKGLKNIQSVWINEQRVNIVNNGVSEWQVIMQIAFIPDE